MRFMAIPHFLFGKLRLCCALFVFAASTQVFGQLASDELVSRTFNLNLPRNNIVRTENGTGQSVPSAQAPSRKEELRRLFSDAGIDLRDTLSAEGRESK